jgi:cytochrome c-type biogenesis protein CcmH/NrfG
MYSTVAVAVALVALAVALWPMRKIRVPVLERRPDPLDEKRALATRALEDLADDRARGALSEEDYRNHRARLEREQAATTQSFVSLEGTLAVEARQRGRLGDGVPTSRRTAVALMAVSLAVSTVPLFAATNEANSGPSGDPEPRQKEDRIESVDPRVQQTPRDVRALLDLAGAYLATSDLESATAAYLDVLEVDPNNYRAHTRLALLLFRAGLRTQALDAVNRALQLSGGHPEGLYVKGLILLMGFEQRSRAASMFEAYLKKAPQGIYEPSARRLLKLTREATEH